MITRTARHLTPAERDRPIDKLPACPADFQPAIPQSNSNRRQGATLAACPTCGHGTSGWSGRGRRERRRKWPGSRLVSPRIGFPATLPPRCDPTSDMWFGRRSVASRGNRWENLSGNRCAATRANTGDTRTSSRPAAKSGSTSRANIANRLPCIASQLPATPNRLQPIANRRPVIASPQSLTARRAPLIVRRGRFMLPVRHPPIPSACLTSRIRPPPPPPRPARPLYSVREADPYGRREIRSSYLAQPQEAGSAYGPGRVGASSSSRADGTSRGVASCRAERKRRRLDRSAHRSGLVCRLASDRLLCRLRDPVGPAGRAAVSQLLSRRLVDRSRALAEGGVPRRARPVGRISDCVCVLPAGQWIHSPLWRALHDGPAGSGRLERLPVLPRRSRGSKLPRFAGPLRPACGRPALRRVARAADRLVGANELLQGRFRWDGDIGHLRGQFSAGEFRLRRPAG